jgi:hypothetical protein
LSVATFTAAAGAVDAPMQIRAATAIRVEAKRIENPSMSIEPWPPS